MTSFASIESDVIRWAEARKIIPNSTAVAQSRKTSEEATELVEAATKLKLLKELQEYLPVNVFDDFYKAAIDEYKDAVGDVLVTLANGAALADVTLVECFEGSYNVIKDRKGTLMPNGIFVKEA